jgi:hypothetical protein
LARFLRQVHATEYDYHHRFVNYSRTQAECHGVGCGGSVGIHEIGGIMEELIEFVDDEIEGDKWRAELHPDELDIIDEEWDYAEEERF